MYSTRVSSYSCPPPPTRSLEVNLSLASDPPIINHAHIYNKMFVQYVASIHIQYQKKKKSREHCPFEGTKLG